MEPILFVVKFRVRYVDTGQMRTLTYLAHGFCLADVARAAADAGCGVGTETTLVGVSEAPAAWNRVAKMLKGAYLAL